MDTNRIRYFCTVAKTQNLHRASEILKISPPALSKSIKLLEQELGRKLLTQVGRNIVVTNEGIEFAREAEGLLVKIDELTRPGHTKSPAKKIRLGSFEVFTTYFLGPLMKDHLPDYALELHELIPGDLERALVARTVDFGITYVPIPHPDVDFLGVGKIQMVVVGRQDTFKNVPFEKLPFAVPISPIEGSPTRVKGLDGWPDERIPRFQKYHVTLMESAMELCRQGLAVLYLPMFVARLHNAHVKESKALHPIDTGKKVGQGQTEVFLVKSKGTIEDDRSKKLAKAIRLICH